MMLRIRHPQDFWSGVVFVAFGIAALWFGRGFVVGTAHKMGPGYFPMLIAWGLVGIGGLLCARSFVIEGAAIERPSYWRQALIVTSILVFAVMIERFGLAPAVAGSILIASFASGERSLIETCALVIGASVAAVLLFIYLLGQPMFSFGWVL